MNPQNPEDLGQTLVQTVDRDALIAEAGDNSKISLLPPVVQSFVVQFNENQNGIQHQLLETAFHDELTSYHTNPENLTKEGMVTLARDYARDALHEYANQIITTESVMLSDLPEEVPTKFNSAITNSYWADTAEEMIADEINAQET